MVTLEAPREHVLTAEQRQIVECTAPTVLVKAAAGTGKTEILARRIESFLNQADNGYAHVMAITYTTRAADELERRLKARIGDLPSRITAQTIHGFVHNMLLYHGTHVGLPVDFQVLSNNEDRVELFQQFNDTNSYPDWNLLDLARAQMRYHPHLDPQHFELWRRALSNAGAVDFGEMLAKAYELLQIPAFARLYARVYGLIVVDEAQNLTEQQYQLITALAGSPVDVAGPRIPIMLLGDPKQSIIQFAGADNTLMDRFAKEYNAKEFALNKNFRSAENLATPARNIARELENQSFANDENLTYPAPGRIEVWECPDEKAEGAYIADWVDKLLLEGLPQEALGKDEHCYLTPEDIAVLARSSSALRFANSSLNGRGHETALVYSDKDFMTTSLGRISILLMKRHSPQHKMTAEWGLCRELGIPDLDADKDEAVTSTLRTHLLDGNSLGILIPLLDAETPQDFVSALLNNCHLPESGTPCPLLAGWHDDQEFISDTWQEFANSTQKAEWSWARFSLHMDRSMRGRDLGPGVRLLTVHKAQGREFKAVAVLGMNDGQFPDFRATSPKERKAELRTFYVAVTRASRVLLLTRARQRTTRYGLRHTEPSPYLKYLSTEGGAL